MEHWTYSNLRIDSLFHRRAVELVKAKKCTVKAPHIKEVNQVMQNTPTAAYLRDLSFHERLMLTSLVKCMKRDGVDEIKWGDVRRHFLEYYAIQCSLLLSSNGSTTYIWTFWHLTVIRGGSRPLRN